MGVMRWTCPVCACQEQVPTTRKRSRTAVNTTGTDNYNTDEDMSDGNGSNGGDEVQQVEDIDFFASPVYKRPKLLPYSNNSSSSNAVYRSGGGGGSGSGHHRYRNGSSSYNNGNSSNHSNSNNR
eukprot:20556-Heterococcus_DN1.PRE.2